MMLIADRATYYLISLTGIAKPSTTIPTMVNCIILEPETKSQGSYLVLVRYLVQQTGKPEWTYLQYGKC